MSRQYKDSKNVPSQVLCDRIQELIDVITKPAKRNGERLPYQFYMRIPAEVDHDADLVMGEIARRLLQVEKERDSLRDLINTPEIRDFIEGVKIEAAHQTNKWGPDHDRRKHPGDWSMLLDKIKGKQCQAWWDGDLDKLQHHLITMAAICANYHKCILNAKLGKKKDGNVC